MNFSTAMQSPVVIQVDDKPISIPRMTIRDWVAWGAEVDAQRKELALKGLPAGDRFRVLSVSSIAPTDFSDLANLVFTPDGIRRIIETCMKNGGVEPAIIKAVLDNADAFQLRALAVELASVVVLPIIPPSGPGTIAPDPNATFASEQSAGSADATLATEGSEGKTESPLTGSATA